MPALVPRRPTSIIAWPVGMAITSWSYLWRITPIHRREIAGSPVEDLPPFAPEGVSRERIQRPEEGAGTLFHRTYTGTIREGRRDAEELMQQVKADPNIVAPLGLARFRKTSGEPRLMRTGDEFVVRMPGPWDGPIRAIDVQSTSFRFATLQGHVEAGQIEWRAREEGDLLVFEIESWARSGDRLSAVMHDRVRMGKEVQLHMWTSVVERVARKAGGKLERGISIETRRVEANLIEDHLKQSV